MAMQTFDDAIKDYNGLRMDRLAGNKINLTKDGSSQVDLSEMELVLRGNVYNEKFLKEISEYYQQMTVADNIMFNYQEKCHLSLQEGWYIAGEICSKMKRHNITESAAIDKFFFRSLASLRQNQELFKNLVDAGDWHFEQADNLKEIHDSSFWEIPPHISAENPHRKNAVFPSNVSLLPNPHSLFS